MTDSEILEQFEELVEDSLSEGLEIQLANTAKNKLERELKLEICKALDESSSTSVGQTYATSITLPTGFRGLARDYIWLGSSKIYPKPLEEAPRWRSSGGFFYIDHRNNRYHLTGTQTQALTICLPHIVKTSDITVASIEAATTTVTWPTDFHPIIPYEMVKLFDQIDRGDKNYSWRAEWDAEYSVLKKSMIDWDHDLKLAALSHSTPYGAEEQSSGDYQINL